MNLTNIERISVITVLILTVSMFYLLTLEATIEQENIFDENIYANKIYADQADEEELNAIVHKPYSNLTQYNMLSGDKNIIQFDMTTDQPVSNETSQTSIINNQVFLTKLKTIVNKTLTAQEALALIEESPDKAANEISNSEVLLSEVLKKITDLDHSEQREYLIRAVNALEPEHRKQASYELLASTRMIDRKNGVALMMSLPEPYEKISQTQFLLQTETDTNVLKILLNYLSSEDDKAIVLATFSELQNIADFNHHEEIKVLALQTLMKVEPASLDITESKRQLY